MAGGNKGGGGGGPVRARSTGCDVYEETDVQSPDAEVAETVKPRDTLHVELVSEGRARLRAVTCEKKVLGGLIPASLPRIVKCIREEGVVYVADVIKKDGGRIRVLIRNAH